MSDQDKNTIEATGLDIGTSRIVVARRVNQDFQFQAQLNAFLTLPFSKLTRNVFEKENIPHKVDGEELIILGNESERLANMYHHETRRPMTHGILNAGEPNSLPIIKQLVSKLLGEAPRERQKLCFSVPGTPLGNANDLTYHEATLRQLLAGFGYEVTSVNEGLAVILAELESSNFTGIGISCGGGMCNVCLAYLSVPIFSFSVPKAGDFIDASAASVTGEGATRIRAIKEESFGFNGHFSDKVQQALAVYYDDMIRSLVSSLREVFQDSRNVPRLDRPVPLVIAGGSVLPAGFRERFETILSDNPLPVALSEVRLAADPLNATAKGALVAALAEL